MIARVMNLVVVPLAVGLVLFGIECANADSLRWNLQNVTFVDDSIASGFFVLNTAQLESPFSDFDIKVTSGRFPAFEYTPKNSFGGYRHCPSNECPYHPDFIGTTIGITHETDHGTFRGLDLLIPAPTTLTQPGTYRLNSTAAGSYFGRVSQEVDQDCVTEECDIVKWVRHGDLTTGIPKPPPRHGPLVTWILEDVKFDDGSAAVGSFVYDASQGTVVDFHVSLSIPGHNGPFIFYRNDLPCESCIGAGASGQGTENLHVTFSTGSHYGEFVELVTAHTLTDKGGTIGLIPGVRLQGGGPFLFSGSGFQCCGLGKDNGILVSGALVGTIVPEPSDALFLALGLVMLMACLSSRRKLLSARTGSCVSESTAT